MTKKEAIITLIITFLVIMIWIGSDIYRTKADVTLTPQLQDALQPIDPSFDSQTLDRIKKINQASLETPTPSPSSPIGPGVIQSTPSGQRSANQATASGQP